MAYTVAVYLVDKAFGGSEEGGWWFEYGEPSAEHAEFTKGFRSEQQDAAQSYADYLNSAFGSMWNKGRRPIDSVLSEGQYFARVQEGQPKPYPATRPHYE